MDILSFQVIKKLGAKVSLVHRALNFQSIVLSFCVLLSVFAASAFAERPYSRENQLQAAFFYKFRGFLQWDPSILNSSQRPVCVIGNTAVGTLIEQLIKNEKADLKVVQIQNIEDARLCSLLYIDQTEEKRLVEILSTVLGQGVVTVSDIADFTDKGGVIQFYTDNERVRFLINKQAAERQRVSVSSQLLALAKKRGE